MLTATHDWLEPLFSAAEHNHVDLWALMQQAAVPLVDPDRPDLEAKLAELPTPPDAPDLRLAVDWVKFGQLVRHELGWEETYPERPDAGPPVG